VLPELGLGGDEVVLELGLARERGARHRVYAVSTLQTS
jgi:hypothetical protein